jgi:hypothetical protein
MKSIRRLYFYLVALIAVEVVVWGLIGLLRSIVDQTVSGGADALAGALALILVGVPIFLIHWLWAQRASAREQEEQAASLRAVFLYGILLGTLIPVAQNLLSFINRALVQSTGLGVERAFSSFREQTLADNLIAIGMNLVVAAYFWNVLQSDWATLKEKENFADVRRFYRYLWMLYGLLMTVFGTQQILRFLFYIPGAVLGEMGREVVVNGLALIVVGTPIWVYAWRLIQDSLVDPAEMGSNLRLGILYLLALGGVITVVSTAWLVVDVILTNLLGGGSGWNDFVREIGGPLSVGIPLGAIWAYYGHWLNRHIAAVNDQVRAAGMRRLYHYILSAIGLVVAFVGVGSLLNFFIDLITSGSFLVSGGARVALATSIASLVVGLPVWLLNWRPMQGEAQLENEVGDHARRSVIRKFYLYLVLFVAVIGGMAAAVGLVYQLIRVVLVGDAGSDFLNTLLNTLQLLFLFGVVLVYHLSKLRADGASTADALAGRQTQFSVLIVDAGDGVAEAVRAALAKLGAQVQVTVMPPGEKPEGDFHALVVSGRSAVEEAPAWIRSFGGKRVIVQNEAHSLVWADDAMQAADAVQRLAEGQAVLKKKEARSAWIYVVYVFAALFALQMLFFLLAFGIALVSGF